MKKQSIIFILIIVIAACSQHQPSPPQNSFSPIVVEAHGYIVPKDSMATPKVILVNQGKLKKIPVGEAKVVSTNKNIHIAITTNIHKAGIPRICTPGKDKFLLPKIVPAIDSPKVAGIPEITIAKDPQIKDKNPQSFSSFSKLQGLKQSAIHSMLQDKSGNLWFGTNGGGISKYDGKFFTHFTDKEGLSNNTVKSILEDKSGNLWFGTYGGGVSKYDGKSFTHYTDKEGLSNNTVWSILEDKSGNLWFGTNGGGVNKYDGQSFTHFTNKEGLSSNTVWSILEDKNGNLWFGTYGGGVCKYDPSAKLRTGSESFTHFTDKEGLSNNIVFSILEDKSGNLWFGSDGGGVSKYDGNRVEEIEAALQKGEIIPQETQQDLKRINGKLVKSFTHFTEKEGLSNNTVWSILEDKSGNLWFGTYGGVSKYDGNRVEAIEAALQRGETIPQQTQQDLKRENGKLVKSFTHFTDKEGLSNNDVRSILEDINGNLWFGTNIGGVSKYDGKSFTHFTDKEGLSNNTVLSILEDKSGNFWIGTDGGGVSKYDGKSFTHFTEKEGLSNNTVWSILEDKSGNIWFGTYSGGVSKYDGNRVEAIEAALQRGEIIPQGTQQDLKKINGKLVKSFTHFTDKEGLSNNTVRSILEDKSGNIWFGTEGGGVSKYDPSAKLRTGSESFTHFTDKEGLSSNIVRSILEDKSGNLWFGTIGGGVSKYDGNRVEAIEAALQRGEIIPQGTQQDLKRINGKLVKSFTHFTDKEGLSNNTIWSILEDKSGNLWFGTNGGGVSKYDGNRVEAIEAALQRGEIIPQGTQQDLKKINGKLVKSFTHFTDKEGLSNNFVTSILEDKSGNLWFGTRFGLSMLKVESLMLKVENPEIPLFKNYNYDDGFYGIGCNVGNTGKNILQDKNGAIWIAANERLTIFHPQGDEADTIPPNIQLTSIDLFNENIAWGNLQKSKVESQKSKEKNIAMDTSYILGNGVSVGNFQFDGITKWYCLPENLSLEYSNNYLTFNFIGITQKQNKKVKYQYKLDGIDENWSAITSRNEAAYGNLPQGNYTFKVKAMNSEGYWSNEFNYTFTIRPPWWKTWWFRSLLGLFIFFSLYSFYLWRTASLRKDKKILEETVEKRTRQLQEEKKETEKQKDLVEKQKEKIIDSITYAQRIQQSILMEESEIRNYLPNSFIYFQPKDIVSGDFYWCSKIDNKIILAAIDCTGHGVPGAFMSMIGNTLLNQIVNEKRITQPSEILRLLNLGVYEALHQQKDGALSDDGMDIALVCLEFGELSSENNKKEELRVKDGNISQLLTPDSQLLTKLQYAGQNPLFVLSGDQIQVIKGDSHGIGGGGMIAQLFDPLKKEFTNHVIPVKKDMSIYLFSDGYVDQFGGTNRKKFGTQQFKELIMKNQHLSMQKQKELIVSAHEAWKGSTVQIDDILVIGLNV